ncbi:MULTISPECIES: ABC transporter substrate-binding protein [unclassified Streptomyces]|uniref:ABC transporter substrate-binding protein n=1 Tax=unclassified Streptomyces TaxID=2593676 RepID=UPI0006AFBDAC|nr:MULTISPECIES: ABC transporter substrate-binding protein [unclassified Streptomyces]KOX19455.1 peptide-binding protein [Streptomyces sp. NRRL F-6491]KOX48306.1 peptide-binding protein [Streptomyces sp. NRRL F-6492]
MKLSRLGIAAGTCALLVACGYRLLPLTKPTEDPIVIGTANSLTHLDPAGGYDSGSWALYSNIYQGLLTFDPGAAAPRLDAAASCAFTRSLTTYRCTVRDGLRFSNGHPLTAAAVKHSFERVLAIRDPLGPSPLFANLRSVEASGSSVTFHLAAADATWPSKIATPAGSIVDPAEFPRSALRTRQSGAGSGPYVVSSYREGVRVGLVPNAAYKGAVARKGKPVEVRYYKTSQDVERAWNARRIDVAFSGLTAATLATVENGKDPEVRLFTGESTVGRYLVLNTRPSHRPLADVAARRAVAALVNRGRLANTVFKDTVSPLYSLVPRGVTGHGTDFYDVYPESDPEWAARHLRAAGLSSPVRIKLGHQVGTAAVEAHELKEQLERKGLFEVELIEEGDWVTYQERYKKGEFDAYILQWNPDFPDPDTFVQPLVGSGNTLYNGYSSAEIDSSIKATQQFADRARTVPQLRRIQRVIAEDVPLVPLWQKKSYVATRPSIAGGHYLVADSSGVWRLWELRRQEPEG